MRLQRLTIRRMPGFAEGDFPVLEFCPGLNVIVGPNASGKTTACRAIRGLLWPETIEGLQPVWLVGEWADDEGALRVELEAQRRTCQRDGLPCEPPSLPPARLAACFTLTIDELFAGSRTDADLAAEVARELAGGYDLAAVREIDAFALRRSHGQRECTALEEAARRARDIRSRQRALAEDEARLGELRRQCGQALEARTRLQRLQELSELLEVREEIAQVEIQLAQLPAGMDRLRGNEQEQLEQIQDDLSAAEGDLAGASASAQEAREELARANLRAGGIEEARLEEQRRRVGRLRELERDTEQCQRQLTEAEAEVAAAASVLGEAEPARLDALDAAGLDELEAFHREAEQLQQGRSAIQARLEVLRAQRGGAGDVEQLAAAVGILREWLELSRSADRRAAPVVWALAVVLALAGVALAVSVHWALVFLVVPALVAVVWCRPGTSDSAGSLRGRQERFERLSIPPPERWDSRAVGERLNALEAELAQARLAEQSEAELRQRQQELAQLEARAGEMERRRAELIERLGVAPDISTLGLVTLADRLRRYAEARAAREKSQAELARLTRQREDVLSSVNAFFAEFGEPSCEDGDVAEVRLDDLARRAHAHRDAARKLAEAERAAEDARGRIERLTQRRRQLFAEAGLDDDAADELAARLAVLEDYRGLGRRLGQLRAQEARLVERFEGEQELLGMDAHELARRAAELEQLASRYEDLVRQISDIQARVEQAGRGSELEEALAKVALATDKLRERRYEADLAAAGLFLLDEVERAHRQESQPVVLRRAGEWFSLFTRGRYELRVSRADSGEVAFRAFDRARGEGLSLEALSRGTRIQLLLAVRLAFATWLEGATKLPIVLDEVLSSSDPQRFAAIAESVVEMVRAGRQVLYFTCQPGDAAGWQQVAGEMGLGGQVARLDLAWPGEPARSLPALLDRSAAAGEPVPAPGGMSLEQYLEALGIRPLDPRRGASQAHVAHFVEDAGQLYRLLRMGVSSYGQLEGLVRPGGPVDFIAPEALRRMQAKACVLDAFAKAWSVGRGRRVTREALVAAGVSRTFIDRVTSLARELGGDARQLVEALERRSDERAKGFRRAALEELRENLEDAGYLDTREPLDADMVQARVMDAAREFIKAGSITADSVRELVARYWAGCEELGPPP